MRNFALVLLAGCQTIVGIPEVQLDPCQGMSLDGDLRQGPAMVKVDAPSASYCIDTTEVTVEQFNAYLIASGQHIDTPAACDGAIPPPLVDSDPAHAKLAVGHVGVCDAWSYCAWAGKRICGAIGGGSARNLSLAQTEWGFACINGQRNTPYPYGTEYDASACATETSDPIDAGSLPSCHGIVAPFDQIFDLSGNRQELVNDVAAASDSIAARGGSWMSGQGATCDASAGFNGFVFDFDESGFRCCADPN